LPFISPAKFACGGFKGGQVPSRQKAFWGVKQFSGQGFSLTVGEVAFPFSRSHETLSRPISRHTNRPGLTVEPLQDSQNMPPAAQSLPTSYGIPHPLPPARVIA